MWKARIVGGGRLKYIGLADALEQDIQAGIIAAGDRLPPQRSIAEALGVDLTTVTRAFNEAHRRGLIEAQIGRGTFVRDYASGRTSKARPAALDLSMNIPCQPEGVDFQQLMPKGVAAVLANGKGLLNLHYQDSAGAEPIGKRRPDGSSNVSRTQISTVSLLRLAPRVRFFPSASFCCLEVTSSPPANLPIPV